MCIDTIMSVSLYKIVGKDYVGLLGYYTKEYVRLVELWPPVPVQPTRHPAAGKMIRIHSVRKLLRSEVSDEMKMQAKKRAKDMAGFIVRSRVTDFDQILKAHLPSSY